MTIVRIFTGQQDRLSELAQAIYPLRSEKIYVVTVICSKIGKLVLLGKFHRHGRLWITL